MKKLLIFTWKNQNIVEKTGTISSLILLFIAPIFWIIYSYTKSPVWLFWSLYTTLEGYTFGLVWLIVNQYYSNIEYKNQNGL